MGRINHDWEKIDAELIRYHNETDLSQVAIAGRLGVPSRTLWDRIVKLRAQGKLPKERPMFAVSKNPLEIQLIKLLSNNAMSLREISRKIDRSPDIIAEMLDIMESEGYHLIRTAGVVTMASTARPKVATPARTLADEVGMTIALGFLCDKHGGSRHAQPSAIHKCFEIMGNEYGVRHFFDAGDGTCGLYVYRGQDEDQIPVARPLSRSKSRTATLNQVELLDTYTPSDSSAEWYVMGGNHDWDHVKINKMDPIRRLCNQRDDCNYLGYDVAGVWITDQLYLRLWHPAGGMPYAKSYRLQKGLEALAIEAMREAIRKDQIPVVSLLVAGHLHSALWMPELPLPASLPGCFEGQTNLFKRKGWVPALGGTVIRFLVTDSGKIQRAEYTFIPFEEIKDDWKNWPVPENVGYQDYSSEDLDEVFQFEANVKPFVIEDPRQGLGLGNKEYVSGK